MYDPIAKDPSAAKRKHNARNTTQHPLFVIPVRHAVELEPEGVIGSKQT